MLAPPTPQFDLQPGQLPELAETAAVTATPAALAAESPLALPESIAQDVEPTVQDVPVSEVAISNTAAPQAAVTAAPTWDWSFLPTPTPTPTPPQPPTRTITEALQSVVMVESPPTPAPLPDTPIPTPPLPQATPPVRIAEPTPDGVERTARVPILMYHYLSAPPPNADIYRLDLSVTPELFAAHLDALKANGYTTISFYDLLANLTQGAPLPAKPVILTFDDGYRDSYENAFPRLAARGMTATFFIITDFIYDQRPEYVTWDMVRAMYAGGMSIEAHGRNHVSLKNKDRDYLIWQALGSLEAIQQEVGVRPRFVSYPAGDYDQLTLDTFQSADYWAGVTTAQGATHSSSDLFRLRRVRVRGTTTPEELLRLAALDW
jgi:peptidoglycan/xylan/chitin deacetylase (PgdA/CDA1 family)